MSEEEKERLHKTDHWIVILKSSPFFLSKGWSLCGDIVCLQKHSGCQIFPLLSSSKRWIPMEMWWLKEGPTTEVFSTPHWSPLRSGWSCHGGASERADLQETVDLLLSTLVLRWLIYDLLTGLSWLLVAASVGLLWHLTMTVHVPRLYSWGTVSIPSFNHQ